MDTRAAAGALDGFKKFLFRGNVIDLAVGIMIGASFGAVVNTLVSGLITPLIAALAAVPDFSALSFTINGSKFMYGMFINALISFVIQAAVIYFLIIVPMSKVIGNTGEEKKA